MTSSILQDALDGLSSVPRQLPPKLFYDATGAALFEQITQLAAYYPTRTEREILTTHAADIATVVGRDAVLIEYGSGAGSKIRLLLDALAPRAYVPVDVSAEQLSSVAQTLEADYPGLRVHPVNADFTAATRLPDTLPSGKRVALFLGSTIGNFHIEEAHTFLRRIAASVGPDGMLLLGVDLKKDPAILHAAYNDEYGITAAFNRNVLERLQRECGASIEVDAFVHYAFYNPVAGRVEMHLVATRPTTIGIGDRVFSFVAGEGIWTESSYKYTVADVRAMGEDSGFRMERMWVDAREWFGVAAFRVAG